MRKIECKVKVITILINKINNNDKIKMKVKLIQNTFKRLYIKPNKTKAN